MSNGTASNIGTALSNAITALAGTPGAITILGPHLTQSEQMQAMQILDTMSMNPAMAAALLPALSAVKNVPPQVVSLVTDALTTPANFAMNISNAKAQLLATHTGLGGLFANLGG